jgi:hypothetical protein
VRKLVLGETQRALCGSMRRALSDFFQFVVKPLCDVTISDL